MNDIEGASSIGIRSLEVEKERMKIEIGAQSSVKLKEEMEASSLWQAIGWLSTIDLSGDD